MSEENIIVTETIETTDMSLLLIVAASLIIAVALIMLLKTRKKPLKIEYVYSEDDKNEQ